MNLVNSIEDTTKVVKNLLVVMAIFIFVLVVYSLVDRNKVLVIQSFEVPDEVKELGLSGEAISTLIYGKIKNIYVAAESERRVSVEGYKNYMQNSIEFENINFSKLVILINQLLGKKIINVNGVIHKKNGGHLAIVMVDGNESINLVIDKVSIDEALEKLSEEIVAITEPYILARYLTGLEQYDDEKVLKLIYGCLSNDNQDDDHWSLNLWGNYYFNKGDYGNAVKKYQEAYNLAKDRGVKFFVALSNLAAAQMSLKEYDQAKENAVKAIRIEDEYYYSYYVLGVLNTRLGEYDRAIESLKKALDRNKTNAGTYYHLSRAIWFSDQDLEKSLRYGIISRDIYKSKGKQRFYKRSIDWIQEVCDTSVEDETNYSVCANTSSY